MIEIKNQNTSFETPLPRSCSQHAVSSESVARAAFALLEKLDSGRRRPPPSIPKVFRLYCIESLSAAEVARKCHCSKAAVIRRLNLIRKKTGLSPALLRDFAPQPPSLGHTQISRNNLLYADTDPEAFSE
jgi:hypothetical protein